MENKQIDMITELLIDFDEMGFAPTTLCPDPEAYAIEWRKKLTEELKGYRKASEVALETVDDFQSRLRHIFLDMCEGNDYNTVNLLQIDSAIEALFDSFVAELKKKYSESEKDNE